MYLECTQNGTERRGCSRSSCAHCQGIIMCLDTVQVEQENLFPKTSAGAKRFKLTSLLLQNRDSLQENCTEVQSMNR